MAILLAYLTLFRYVLFKNEINVFDFHIQHVGCYRHEQCLRENIPYDGICFTISGFRRQVVHGRDWAPLAPAFVLAIKGEAADSIMGPGRENWVIILRGLDLRRSAVPELAEITWKGRGIRLPVGVPVPRESIPGWRRELQSIQAALRDPAPQSQAMAHLGVLGILRHMISQVSLPDPPSPARRFKDLLDSDDAFRTPLSRIAAQCGYSADHLRILFLREFSMAPHEYLNQRRVAKAMDLIAASHLSVKQIADQLGFQHVSALSAMFRKRTGRSPRDAIRLHRLV